MESINLPEVVTENLPSPIKEEELGGFLMDPKMFEHAQRVAKLYAASELVPERYRNKIADCFLALNRSHALGIDTQWFMEKSYCLKGKVGLEGKLVIALVNKKRIYKENLDFEFTGSGDTLSCTCIGVRHSGKVDKAKCDMKMARDEGWLSNPHWKAIPEQMLRYRSAAFLINAYCPEVLCGCVMSEEILDIDGAKVMRKEPSQGAKSLNAKLVKEGV